MTENTNDKGTSSDPKEHLNKRFEAVAWGLFLIMIGCLWLIPNDQVPEGTWLIGVGVIMLGINLARNLKGIKMSGFTIFLGILALCIGIGDYFGVDLPIFPILIILWGFYNISKSSIKPDLFNRNLIVTKKNEPKKFQHFLIEKIGFGVVFTILGILLIILGLTNIN